MIVGAAIVQGDRVLAAQRAEPPELAGGWEFPGGKVEDGETEEQALVRECREELAVEIEVGERLGEDVVLHDGRWLLRVWAARLVTGMPTAVEHSALRWLSRDELSDVAWLPADRPLVEELRRLLPAS
ncbi:MAG: DNA mismatch repair protein MutT [Pseudonocardiales bacterium]|nr:MAG: DNA mismatch repair protein MutT [Pseudonocardiales bacterium]